MSEAMAKLVVVVLAIGSSVALRIDDSISAEAAVGIITACLGYVFGNGHGIIEAKRSMERQVQELATNGIVDRRDDTERRG